MNQKFLLTALWVAAVSAGCQPTGPAPASQAKPQIAPAQSHAKSLQTTHEALLAEADKLPIPAFLAVPQPVASHTGEVAVRAEAPEIQLPPVAPEQQVHLVLTSGVIGEIDPCG